MPESRPFTFAFAPTVAGGRYASTEHVEPFRHYLERVLGQPVRTALPASYRESFASLRAGRVDAAMVGDLASREGEDQGGIEPLVSEVRADSKARTYRSAFATRSDTGIRSLPMLRGRLLGLVDGSSTSGYLVPRAMLHEAGIDPDRDLEIRVFGSHREVVDALLDGLVDAGAMHEGWLTPDTIDRGPDFARLRVLARSGPIPAGPMVVRSSLDPDLRARLRDAMLRIHEADPAAARVMLSHGHRFTEAHRRGAPTLKSIASLAGVSYATVSRVVNASGYVAPETARRVRAIIDEVGYAPNGNARVLLGRQFPLVGMVVAFGDEALAGILPVVERLRGELERQGVPFVLYPVGEALDRSLVADLVRDKRLGALIVTGAHAHDPLVTALARTGHPVFALAPPPLAPGMIAATPDELANALLADLAID